MDLETEKNIVSTNNQSIGKKSSSDTISKPSHSKEFLSKDLLFSLFMAALNSSKKDKLIRPYPNAYRFKNNQKNFEALHEDCNCVHGLVDKKQTSLLNSNLQALINSITNPKKYKLKFHNNARNTFKEIFDTMPSSNYKMSLAVTKSVVPNFVVELVYNQEENLNFQSIKGKNKVISAFHGSSVENFYSILVHGLTNSLNKTSLFGEGTYLTTCIRTSLNYSPFHSKNWQYSVFGPNISIVACCEVIDDPDHVVCSNVTSKSSHLVRKTKIVGSEGGKVPDSYIVVRNDQMVRVKYLFVYTPNCHRRFIQDYLAGKVSSFTSIHHDTKGWVEKNKFVLLMLGYVCFLLFYSLLNSNAYLNIRKKYAT